MVNQRRLFHITLCGLFLLLFITPCLAITGTDSITICIEKYKSGQNMSYEEAKKLCTAQVQTPTQSQPSSQPVSTDDACIKKYMTAYNLTYEDAKKKCYPVSTVAPVQSTINDCIVKLKTEKGMSYEEAKKQCAPQEPVQGQSEGCIKKYMDIFNISYEAAKKKCAGADATTVLINRCGELEKKLNTLIDKMNSADVQDIERLKKDIEAIKVELKSCEAKAPQVKKEVTPGIKNPCDELQILKQSLEQLDKKIAYIKELISKSEMNDSDLAPYHKEYSYLNKKIENMKFACQQGKPLEESPCARLSKLEVIYKQINDKIEGTQDEKSRLELNETLASIVKEITTLKQKCKAESLKTEKVDSLTDIENAYRAKQKTVVEGTSEKELQVELQKIEDEKKKLLEDFALRLKELDARQTAIIKKFKIKDGAVIMDDIKTKASRVKVEIKDKDIEIEPTENGTSLTDGNTTALGDVSLEYADGVLVSSKSGKEIKVMPSEIKRAPELSKSELTELKLIDDGKPQYHAKGEKKGKLLGIIPTTVVKEYRISAENGIVTDVNAPWWSAIVSE